MSPPLDWSFNSPFAVQWHYGDGTSGPNADGWGSHSYSNLGSYEVVMERGDGSTQSQVITLVDPAQAPSLDSVEPQHLTINGPDVQITATGSGMADTSVVYSDLLRTRVLPWTTVSDTAGTFTVPADLLKLGPSTAAYLRRANGVQSSPQWFDVSP